MANTENNIWTELSGYSNLVGFHPTRVGGASSQSWMNEVVSTAKQNLFKEEQDKNTSARSKWNGVSSKAGVTDINAVHKLTSDLDVKSNKFITDRRNYIVERKAIVIPTNASTKTLEKTKIKVLVDKYTPILNADADSFITAAKSATTGINNYTNKYAQKESTTSGGTPTDSDGTSTNLPTDSKTPKSMRYGVIGAGVLLVGLVAYMIFRKK